MRLSLLFLLLASQLPCFGQQKEQKPNVLLIMVDDLNNYVGFMGGHPQTKTPGMDKLAAESVIFTNAFSNNPICAPSRASFFSGLYPHTSKNFGFKKFQKNEILMGSKTMMELFMENGYKVAGTGKLMHHFDRKLYHQFGDKSDFGPFPFNGTKPVGHPSVPEPFRSVGTLDGSFAPLSDVPTVNGNVGWFDKVKNWPKYEVIPFKYNSDDDRDLMPDEVKAQDAIKFLKSFEKNTDQPFFLSVGFNRPHTPLYVPEKYFNQFPLDQVKLPDTSSDVSKIYFDTQAEGNSGQKGYTHYAKLVESFGNDKDLALRKYIQAYLACVAFVDDQISEVLNALDNSNLAENTIVILVSDHAYVMGDKQYLYKNALWDEATRIPMLIKYPQQQKKHKVDHPVSLIDIYPTLIEMCGLEGTTIKNEKGKPLDGHSLYPFVINKKNDYTGKEYALSTVTGGMGDVVKRNHFSIRTKEYRYIRYANNKEELYDHKKDPFEKNNVAKDKKYKAIKAELSMLLDNEIYPNK
ncbi:sulfatase [Flammeovirga sp. MY04]|uniref:Iduronate-sulfatase and sulfatase 1 n=1 Tax=Flammeovirga yaeyamensis TaxID=367791 RepID=D0PR12_9BACT|nr:sulfatase [Flammeovirga sp. MY04]ACY02055.1 iduronate-sulfatase and sulfatase 1 precursor [Flammeovirga yaeyamensis]ANQ51451.1 sulfatase [Flammeovirga sp. MY04]